MVKQAFQEINSSSSPQSLILVTQQLGQQAGDRTRPEEAGHSPTSRHEEGDAEPALQHPLPQGRQARPVEGKRPADEDVQHDA